jgi:hypothetical protein
MAETSRVVWERAISESIMLQDTNTKNLHPGPAQTAPRAEADRVIKGQLVARAAPMTTIRTSSNQINPDTAAINRPSWSRDRLPVLELTPIQMVVEPIIVDQFVIQPYPNVDIVYVAPSEVSLLNFSLFLRRSVLPDRSLAITGGSASFSISVYASDNMESISLLRVNWDAALKQNNLGERNWSYQPEKRQGLSVSLELPLGIAASEPLILTSPIAGACNITVELTESGALAWKTALEQGAGSTIAGVFRVSSSSLAVDGVAMRLDRRSLDTTVGKLLAGRGAADIRYMDPQQTVQGKLIIVTNDFIERLTVALRPNQGLAPTSQTFGPEGGQVEASVSTQDVASVAIDWFAQVAFTSLGWPPIQASGRLTSANGWTDMIKPDSWIVNYLLMVIPVDDHGQAQAADVAGTTMQLQGVLNFTAPYVANGLLNSSFQAEYFRPINIALPRYPGQPFGDVVLTIFATRNSVGGMQSRKLKTDEVSLVVLIYPDARVEIRTGLDALAELSSASEVLGLMESL